MTAFLVSSFIFILVFYSNFILSSHLNMKSQAMMRALRGNIDWWKYDPGRCEWNCLNGIRHLIQLNGSHSWPIIEATSFIYFIRKINRAQHPEYELTNPMFGAAKAEWPYHCCLGFKDLYVDQDWFIDLSYHLMLEKQAKSKGQQRLIKSNIYLPNIPDTVNIYVIPLTNLLYFIDKFTYNLHSTPFTDLKDFSDNCIGTNLMHIFNTPELRTVRAMLNESILYKFEDIDDLELPPFPKEVSANSTN